MHFLLCIADRLDIKRKFKDALCDDLKISTRDDMTSDNHITNKSRADFKILLESKINKVQKIMQTDNASSYQQLIYCNSQRENESQKSLHFKRYVVIREMQIC
jgi:hypothetical protein